MAKRGGSADELRGSHSAREAWAPQPRAAGSRTGKARR